MRYISRCMMAAGILACLASCIQVAEIDMDNMSSTQLRARIEGSSAPTRVDFDEITGQFAWTDGDVIDIHTSAGAYRQVAVDAAGNFSLPTSGSEQRDGYAVYPAGIVTDDNALTVVLPDNYAIEGSMEHLSPAPMIAVNDPTKDDLFFYHAGALIRMTLSAVPANTRAFAVTLDKRISGSFTVAGPDTATPAIATDDSTEGKTVTFTLASPLAEAADGFILNLPVPIGTYETLKVEMKNASGTVLKTYTHDRTRHFARGRGRQAAFPLNIYAFGPISGTTYRNVAGTPVIWFDGHAAQSGRVQIDSYKSADGGLTKTSVPLEIVAYATADENGYCNEDWTTEIPSGLTGVTITDRNQQQKYLNVSISEQTEKTVNREIVEHAQNLKSRTPAKNLDLSLYDPTDLRTPRASGKPRTANCYVVNRPGTYRFPVVYGNAVDWEKAPSTGCNTDAYIYDATKENTNIWYNHFQRFDDNLITSPYILEDVGLTVDDVEAVVLWEDVPSAAFSMLGGSPTLVEQAPACTYCQLDGTQLATVPYIQFEVPVGAIDPDENTDPAESVTGIRQGNIVIAIRTLREVTVSGNPVEAGTILWSWHIWITDNSLKPMKTILQGGSSVASDEMMPQNLGWCDTKVLTRWHDRGWYIKLRQSEGMNDPIIVKVIQKGEKEGNGSSGTFYQWGRKDPFLPSTGTGNINKPAYSPIGRTLTTSESAVVWSGEPSDGPASAIRHPEILYFTTISGLPYPSSSQRTWMAEARRMNLWNIKMNSWNNSNHVVSATRYKSVYDPCPVGFQVPHLMSFSFCVKEHSTSYWTSQYSGGYIYLQGVDVNGDGVLNAGDYENGWWLYTGVDDKAMFLPAAGERAWDTGSLERVNNSGHYHLSAASDRNSGHTCSFYPTSLSAWNAGTQCCAIRPIRE